MTEAVTLFVWFKAFDFSVWLALAGVRRIRLWAMRRKLAALQNKLFQLEAARIVAGVPPARPTLSVFDPAV